MSKSASKSKSKGSLGTLAKELQKKVDDLQLELNNLKTEHDELKTRYKTLCKKIVDNTDMSDYSYMDAQIEPDKIELNDLLHMVQKQALLASQITAGENIESHVESLELRITELTNENSSFFKNKLKLQERLEFIMQERDVWKRNAETLKKMYAKLVKEKEFNSHVKTSPSANKCTIGTYRANIDSNNLTERIYSAPVPKEYFDTVRNINITNLQLDKIDQTISNQLSQLNSQSTPTLESDSNRYFFANNYSPIPNQNLTDSYLNFASLDTKYKSESRMSDHSVPTERVSSPDSAFHAYSDRQINTTSTNKKNVSFNKDIDVRIFRKNSKNLTKIVDSFMLPLPQNQSFENSNQQFLNGQQEQINIEKNNVVEENISLIKKALDENNNTNKNRIINRAQTVAKSDVNSFFSIAQKSPSTSASVFSSSDTRLTNRGSVCSNRKLPGETSVRELEPTLKLIIIKELSVEKLDGKDWRTFALRVGITENEVKDWISLKLQYPMARVLSFWSSKPDATVRLLHRHLNAPCFNYGALAKRIENFYDVI
ncbi:unnamed protein product [Brachionus calyciflorus]|uniref:Death domain-containing protein n=1 Tax=Brachionus calyciflorus TaxID=104777 RepID=A0A813NJZ9_9BILA|nr:unnamed protein product [Brachionus calyciflorus]